MKIEDFEFHIVDYIRSDLGFRLGFSNIGGTVGSTYPLFLHHKCQYLPSLLDTDSEDTTESDSGVAEEFDDTDTTPMTPPVVSWSVLRRTKWKTP